MTAKTTHPPPTPEVPRTGDGCCGGKAHGAPVPEQGSRDTVSDAQHDAKPGGCCCGKG